MSQEKIVDQAAELANTAQSLAEHAAELALQASQVDGGGSINFFIIGLTVFVLACFVGYYVVWNVTPALHSPLMGVTNAISSVIIVGAIIAAGPENWDTSKWMGLLAIVLASINIFGGFIVTRRMLHMFRKKG